MSIAAVVLAAGESTRLGRPKQEVVLNGETLLHRTVRIAGEAGLDPVIVVVREARYIEPLREQGATVLLNRQAFEGMSSSVRTGIGWVQQLQATGALLLTCDQPGITPAHLRALIATPTETCGSVYADRIGVPAYFPAARFAELLQLRGDVGARALLADARSVPLKTLSIDIDTEEDFRAAQILFER